MLLLFLYLPLPKSPRFNSQGKNLVFFFRLRLNAGVVFAIIPFYILLLMMFPFWWQFLEKQIFSVGTNSWDPRRQDCLAVDMQHNLKLATSLQVSCQFDQVFRRLLCDRVERASMFISYEMITHESKFNNVLVLIQARVWNRYVGEVM